MVISNDDLIKLVNLLPDEAKQSAYDFLRFLTIPNSQSEQEGIEQSEQDDIASSEEAWQLKNNTEFVSWENEGVKRAPNLEIDKESSAPPSGDI